MFRNNFRLDSATFPLALATFHFIMAHPSFPQSYPKLNIKLDGTNYYDRAISVELLFDNLDLLGYIEDSGHSDETKTSDWHASDRRARVVITQSGVINMHLEICTMRTSQTMWDYLRSRFHQSSHAQTYAASQALSTTFKDEHTIQELFHYLQTK